MLSAAVISYQLTIIISLIAARFFGAAFNKPDALFWVALGWTVFTFAFVFVSPLLILQLVVIWGVTAWIRPKDGPSPPSKLETLTAEDEDWQRYFQHYCESPAEIAFLDAMVAALKAKGVEVLGHVDEGYGKFAWILDPDGVKIELWEQREAPD